MKLKILQAPNEILYRKSVNVEKVDKKIRTLMLQMLDVMYKSNGIGLAAPQVGFNLNIFTMDLQIQKENKVENDVYFIVNPKFIYKSEEKMIFDEGCLSVKSGGKLLSVERHKEVEIEYLDFEGKKRRLKSNSDLMSACIQHEYDHLLGITIEQSGFLNLKNKQNASVNFSEKNI